MSLKNKVIKNLFSNWAGLIVTIVISFFMAPYIVHKLGNTFYGIWSIINQFTAYLYIFDFGIRESVIRYTAKYLANKKIRKLEDVLQASFYIYLGVSLISILFTLILALVFEDVFDVDKEYATEASVAILLIGGTITQLFVFNMFNGFLMGVQRYDIFNIVQICGTLVKTALFVLVLEADYGIVALAAVQFTVFLFTGLIMTKVCLNIASSNEVKINLKPPAWDHIKATYHKVFNYSLYVFINNIGQKIIFMTDAIIIGIFMPVASVTFYAIAGMLVEYLRKLVTTSTSILNPLVSHYSASNENDKIQYALVSGTKLTLFIALPVVTVLVLLGEIFIDLWMGEEFAAISGEILVILAVAQAFSAPHFSIVNVLYGMNKHKTLAHFRIVEAICNLVLSIVLINYYGLVGVALGTAIPHIILTSMILPWYATKQINMSLSNYMISGYLRPMIAILPFIFSVFYLKNAFPPESLLEFFVSVFIVCLLYLFVSYLVVFTSKERSSINTSILSFYNKRVSR
ncbi:MAG: oligosaccharide flippase family protein [Gammaproteobacteria bacterium]|nr:oligosaccharide flippase family protein [Gammaproteobacteria bacterium]